ncbi:hypothetical protein KY312_02465 [Candidatus Woesearchaeota archaeon]|nr:hypothetical protein [Candidatus Woesearchaeota archaeon]
MLEVMHEEIQQVLERQCFLTPRQVIEHMAGQFTDRRLGWDDFYEILVGVFKKDVKPLTDDEYGKHHHDLLENKIYADFPMKGRGFIVDDFDLPIGKNMRFYLNAHNASGGREILKSIVNEFRDQRFKIKTVARDRYGFFRYDNTVLYVNINDANNYVDFLRQLSLEHPCFFDSEVPLLTRKLARGIGYSASPLKNKTVVLERSVNPAGMSANEMHSVVLQITFDKVIEELIEDYDDITELYVQALQQARFNPEKPYLIHGVDDLLEKIII